MCASSRRWGRSAPIPHRLLRLLIIIAGGVACTTKPAGQSVTASAQSDEVRHESRRDAEPSPIERQVLNQIVFRSREQQAELSYGIRALEAGRAAEGLAHLQRVLDAQEDGFLWNGSRPRLVSVRGEAARLLSSLPRHSLRTYEQLYGPEAQRALEQALDQGDAAAVEEVARRYFHTAAGFRAADWQASRWFDHGRADLAGRRWQQLLDDPAHRQRVTRALETKAAWARELSGSQSNPVVALKQVHTGLDQAPRLDAAPITSGLLQPASVRDKVVPAGFSEAGFPSTGEVRTALAQMAARDRGAKRGAPATTPYLKPLWSAPFLSEGDQELGELLVDWQCRQIQQLDPAAVANCALVVADKIVIRDFRGIRALDAHTGESVWQYHCESSLAVTARQLSNAYPAKGQPPQQLGAQLNLQHAFAGNSLAGKLTTDGRRVFVVDGMDLSYPSPATQQRAVAPRGAAESADPCDWNRLIALDVLAEPSSADGQNQPAWRVGGPRTNAADQPVLAGHFFLGSPLAADGRLFAVTEADRQLNLVALDAETGKLHWSQGIGFVEMPIPLDPARSLLSCCPAYADGIVICPTQLGILVGVDAVSGSLVWASYYGNAETMRGFGRWPHTAHRAYGHAGFPDAPQVAEGRIVCLPRHSDAVLCLNVHSGDVEWTAPRDDAEYIAAIARDVVLVVGRRICRGLSLATGDQLWSTRLGMPSGVGLAARDYYLLPLQEGRIATLELLGGRELGLTRPRDDAAQRELVNTLWPAPEQGLAAPFPEPVWAPGNLVAYEDTIISAGIQQLDVFPQAAPLLVEVEAELKQAAPTADFQLLAAELQLALGDLVGAKFQLSSVLAQELSSVQRQQADALLRETLYQQLQTDSADEQAILDEIDPLAQASRERGRYLVRRVKSQLENRDLDGVYASLHELADLRLPAPLPTHQDQAHLMSPAAWIAGIREKLPEYFSPSELDELELQIDRDLQAAVASNDLSALEHFHATYAPWPQADRARLQLGQILIGRGDFQRAELLLLECRRSDDPQLAASATQSLVEVWDRLGLYQDAALLLNELNERFADQLLDGGTTGADYVAQFPRARLSWDAYSQRQPLKRDVHRVSISETRWFAAGAELEEAYSGYRRKLPTPDGQTFDLLERGSGPNTRLTIVDTQSGVTVGEMSLPAPNQYPSPRRSAHVGHLIPVGTAGGMNGISLLDRGELAPYWTIKSAQAASKETLRVGPAGANFCTFQSRQQFVVVDPRTGQIVWQRNDLDPECGLLGSTSYGIFGDDEVLVLFSDKSAYTVYRTATGAIHAQGRLRIYERHQPHTFGRRLFYLCDTEQGRRLRVWDPLDDRIVIDEPADGRVFSEPLADDELLVLVQPLGDNLPQREAPPGHLHVINMAEGTMRLDVEFTAAELEHVDYVRASADAERFYVNLPRNNSTAQPRRYSYHATSSFVPTVDLQGDLYAIDRRSGRRLWKRDLPQRSLIQAPQYRLPFLMAISNVRDPWDSRRKGLLVEVIDGATGQTIGCKDNNFADRILQTSYDREAAAVRLYGLRTRIDIEFGDAVQRLAIADGMPL